MNEFRWCIEPLNRSLAARAAEWDALNSRVLDCHPMMDSRYVDALLRHFGEGNERLCRYERNGTTAGLAILKPSRPGIWASFVPTKSPGFPLAPMILENPASLARLPRALPGWVGQVDVLSHDPALSPIANDPGIPSQAMGHALTMGVRLEGDFEAYWQKRSGNLRGALRQRMNRVAKAGLQSRLVRREAPEDMADAVRRYARLEMSGWKGREGSAVSPDNAKGRFYREILETYARSKQAAVYEYWLGDRHAASQMIIFNDRMAIYLKTTYDESFANLSPGLLLLQELIRDCFSRLPGGVFEFYTNTNGSPLQLAWATDQRWIEHVSVFRSPAMRQVASAIQQAKSLAAPLRGLVRKLRPAPSPRLDPDSTPAAL